MYIGYCRRAGRSDVVGDGGRVERHSRRMADRRHCTVTSTVCRRSQLRPDTDDGDCICAVSAATRSNPTGRHTSVPLPFWRARVLLSGGSLAEWLACWTQAQKGLGSSRVTVLGKLFTPTVALFTISEIGSSPLKGCDGNWRKVTAA